MQMFMGIDQRLAVYVAFYFIICSSLFADDVIVRIALSNLSICV